MAKTFEITIIRNPQGVKCGIVTMYELGVEKRLVYADLTAPQQATFDAMLALVHTQTSAGSTYWQVTDLPDVSYTNCVMEFNDPAATNAGDVATTDYTTLNVGDQTTVQDYYDLANGL